MEDKLAKVRAEIERRKKLHEKSLTNPIHEGFGLQKVIESKISELTYLLSFIDSMQKEPVSEDKMTISKEWFEHCKKSWYNEGYIEAVEEYGKE